MHLWHKEWVKEKILIMQKNGKNCEIWILLQVEEGVEEVALAVLMMLHHFHKEVFSEALFRSDKIFDDFLATHVFCS